APRTVAAAALARTRDLRIGTSIVPAFTRHPLALATQAVLLAQLAPGRFRLGIGTGNLAVMAEGFGTPLDRPVARMREYLDVLRPALATGEVRHPGRYYGVDAALPAAGPQDIHVAAMGPHMFALAGELADGAMSWMCPLDHLDAVARPALARGAARGGPPVPAAGHPPDRGGRARPPPGAGDRPSPGARLRDHRAVRGPVRS